MSLKKRGERNELRPKQKHNALVPIKSVHSNFLLEKDKTKRVKVRSKFILKFVGLFVDLIILMP